MLLILSPIYLLFFFFSALFAFWLRSSVVSVLFSLISESVLRNTTLINLIFGSRGRASVLAHALTHSVIGLTLPPIDANPFHQPGRFSDRLEKSFRVLHHLLTLLDNSFLRATFLARYVVSM
ncbi:hypothetical protein BDW66DRAFT_84747 [Aspergillus desertorum]